jgi:glycosyl transferase family 25
VGAFDGGVVLIPSIYIISLASATQRRIYQTDQSNRLGFKPIWQNAYGVNDFSEDVFLQHAFDWQRPLIKTEVGCFLSHLEVWKKIAVSDCPAVILEDDVILTTSSIQAFEELSTYENADIINLEAAGKKQVSYETKHKSFLLRKLVLNSSGAAAYMLWPSGAKKLLKHYQSNGAALADVFINESRSLSSWQIVPAVVIQQCMLPYYDMPEIKEGVSQIAREKYDSPKCPNIWIKLVLLFRRIKGEVNKGLIKLMTFFGHERIFIPYLDNYRNK